MIISRFNDNIYFHLTTFASDEVGNFLLKQSLIESGEWDDCEWRDKDMSSARHIICDNEFGKMIQTAYKESAHLNDSDVYIMWVFIKNLVTTNNTARL